jgi:hypothetical protein
VNGVRDENLLSENFRDAMSGGNVYGNVPFLQNSDASARHTALICNENGIIGAVAVVSDARLRDGDQRAVDVAARMLGRIMED